MKNILLSTLLLSTFYFEAFSQSPIVREDIIPAIGYTGTTNYGDYANPGSAGLNQTWDLSNIGLNTQAPYSIVDVSTTPFASSFPNSEYASLTTDIQSGQNAYSFTSQDGSKEVLDGVNIPGLNLVYSDPQLLINFPITYGDVLTDTFEGIYNNGFEDVTRSGSASYEVDGHGTLIMPYGTFTDVYRVKLIYDYSDVSTLLPTYEYYNVNYFYFKAGVYGTLAAVATLEAFGSTTEYTTYLDESSVSISELSPSSIEVSVSPNPIKNVANIVLNTETNEDVMVELFDLTGKKLGDISNVNTYYNNRIEYDFSSYPAGMYLLRLKSNSSTVTEKILIQ